MIKGEKNWKEVGCEKQQGKKEASDPGPLCASLFCDKACSKTELGFADALARGARRRMTAVTRQLSITCVSEAR